MRAGVQYGFELAILGAGDYYRLATHGHRKVVARLRNLAFMGEVHPVAFKDVLHLQVKQFLVGEDTPITLITAGFRIRDHRVAYFVCKLVEFASHVVHSVLFLGGA